MIVAIRFNVTLFCHVPLIHIQCKCGSSIIMRIQIMHATISIIVCRCVCYSSNMYCNVLMNERYIHVHVHSSFRSMIVILVHMGTITWYIVFDITSLKRIYPVGVMISHCFKFLHSRLVSVTISSPYGLSLLDLSLLC